MNILILNSQKKNIYLDRLKKIFNTYKDDKLILYKDKIKLKFIKKKKINLIISFHYMHLIRNDILKFINFNAFNFHNSNLPQNRGMYPVLWSAVSNNFAICLHQMNGKIDEGNIVFKKQIKISRNKSLLQAYNILENNSLILFKKKWNYLRKKIKLRKKILSIKQRDTKMSYNNNFKSQVLLSTFKNGWHTKIKDAQKNYSLICKFF